MMIPPISFNKKLLIGFISAIAIIAAIKVVDYNTIKETRSANNWVSHTHTVIENTTNILFTLTDAEDGENQYLLSRSPQKIENYYKSVSTLQPSLVALRNLVADNPPQVRIVDSLIKYTVIRQDEMSAQLPDKNGRMPEITRWATSATMQHCKQIAGTIIANEKKLLVIRTRVSEQKTSAAMWIVLVSTVFVISLLSFLFVFISRTFLTNQKLREKLQLSESIFAGAFRDSGIGMALVSLAGGWIDVNPYLLDLLGYEKNELLAKTFQEITYPGDLKADLALIAKVLAGEIETYKLEKRYFHKSCHIVWGLLTVSLVRDEGGMPRFFVAQIEDITAAKNREQELKLKNSMLSQTALDLENKIQQMEEFNRMVAHNLRGPAGGIEAMINMVIEEEDPAEKDSMLRLVLGSSQSMNATLRELMQILEIKLNQTIEYNDCDLEDITKTTIQMLQGEILRSRATINTNFSAPIVRFPKVYMESLFYNMISNSLKYKKDELPVVITIASEEENGKVKITFTDNGLGIDLDRHGKNMFKLNKIFHTGFDSKGVGLFITKNQLETHGGSISVESDVGVGTSFIIYL